MPWTPKQVRFLLSRGSPLTGGQRSKMVGELHSNPALGHKRKGATTTMGKAMSPKPKGSH